MVLCITKNTTIIRNNKDYAQYYSMWKPLWRVYVDAMWVRSRVDVYREWFASPCRQKNLTFI